MVSLPFPYRPYAHPRPPWSGSGRGLGMVRRGQPGPWLVGLFGKQGHVRGETDCVACIGARTTSNWGPTLGSTGPYSEMKRGGRPSLSNGPFLASVPKREQTRIRGRSEQTRSRSDPNQKQIRSEPDRERKWIRGQSRFGFGVKRGGLRPGSNRVWPCLDCWGWPCLVQGRNGLGGE